MPKAKKSKEELTRIYDDAISDLIQFTGSIKWPDLGNRDVGALVDMVGRMKVLEKDLKQITGAINTIIDSKLDGKTSASGDTHNMTIQSVTQNRLVTELARDKLLELGGQAAVDACTKSIDMEQHRYSEI